MRVGELERELQRLSIALGELKLLNELSLAASGALTLDEKLKLILEKSVCAVDAEQGSILLATGDREAPFRTLMRQDDRSSLRPSYHIGEHISGYVLYHKKPLLIPRLESDRRFETTGEERTDIKSVLCVPIMNQDELIGVLMMLNKKTDRSFSEDDQRLLSIIAAQSGQLIVNSRLQEEKLKKDQQLVLSHLESERLLALDRWRSTFYENISHEFRTPLTLILAPLEQLIATARKEELRNNYLIMRRNAQRLLRLISEMLDMSRIEARSMKLQVAPGDILIFVSSIVDAFSPVAVQKEISLKLSTSLDRCNAFFDAEKLEKVFYNLFSNALKFTPPKGRVDVSISIRDDGAGSVSTRQVVVGVADSGPGIPQESIGHVFDRYFQVRPSAVGESSGSGIGLTLTKELVVLHHGTIAVQSPPGGGSRFIVQLPADRASYADTELAPESVPGQDRDRENITHVVVTDEEIEREVPVDPAASSALQETLPLMLIVEDNPELRRYMRDFLVHKFRVLEASDGQQGMTLAVETLPDIVVSDIVMPGIDGVELCRRLKTDERTSHIPVLLLTARSSQELKVVGLETGADDYLVKPFDWPEFSARVRNIMESRERLRQLIERSATLKPSEVAIVSMDEVFLKKTVAVVEQSMGDENFTVEDLAAGVSMSYGQLHRKLFALTKRTPAQFIRQLRLQRALAMIQKNAGTISEISYTVGFGSPAYFTRCFHEQFGMAPADARARAGYPSLPSAQISVR